MSGSDSGDRRRWVTLARATLAAGVAALAALSRTTRRSRCS